VAHFWCRRWHRIRPKWTCAWRRGGCPSAAHGGSSPRFQLAWRARGEPNDRAAGFASKAAAGQMKPDSPAAQSCCSWSSPGGRLGVPPDSSVVVMPIHRACLGLPLAGAWFGCPLPMRPSPPLPRSARLASSTRRPVLIRPGHRSGSSMALPSRCGLAACCTSPTSHLVASQQHSVSNSITWCLALNSPGRQDKPWWVHAANQLREPTTKEH